MLAIVCNSQEIGVAKVDFVVFAMELWGAETSRQSVWKTTNIFRLTGASNHLVAYPCHFIYHHGVMSIQGKRSTGNATHAVDLRPLTLRSLTHRARSKSVRT
jgi:hypothetical protein